MKRLHFTIIVGCLVLGVAGMTAGKATHVFYTFDAYVFFLADPFDYFTHEADGWFVVKDLPIGAVYWRQMDGVTEQGSFIADVYGTLSVDFAEGNFHGPVTLNLPDTTCSGHFRSKRVDYFESGRWVLQCSDGSKIDDTFEFTFTPGQPTWWAEGHGRMLIPQE